MEFSETIFQAWKFMENNVGRGKSWEILARSWKLYNYLHNLLTVV